MTPERNCEGRQIPVMDIKEFMDQSASLSQTKEERFIKAQIREQKIVHMNKLSIIEDFDCKDKQTITSNNDAQSNADFEEISMTQAEYEQLLDKYEEIEDLTCAICFDKM